MLAFGRVLAGAATSLLFSVFEAWLVCEHTRREISVKHLGDIFSTAIFANSCVAVLAGILAQLISDSCPFQKMTLNISEGYDITYYIGKYTLPFDMALGTLILCFCFVTCFFNENYGGGGGGGGGESATDAGTAESAEDSLTPPIPRVARPVFSRGMGVLVGTTNSRS